MLKKKTTKTKRCSALSSHVVYLELGSVADIIIFWHGMRLDSVAVAMEIVFIERSGRYFIICVKYCYYKKTETFC